MWILLGPRDAEASSHDPFGDAKIPTDIDDWRHVETVYTYIYIFCETVEKYKYIIRYLWL